MKSKIILCECGFAEHQLIFAKDDEENLVYLQIHLRKLSVWGRIINATRYIFGYQSRYGAFDSIILSKDHAEDIKEIYEHLIK